MNGSKVLLAGERDRINDRRTRIDPEKFFHLQHDAGMSSTALRAAGVSSIVHLSITRGLSGPLTLETAGAAVHAIGARLAEVLDEGDSAGEPIDSDDTRTLEAILFRANAVLRWDTICEITGWKRSRLKAAIAGLDRELAGRGLAVSHTPGYCQLRVSVEAPTWAVLKKTDRKMALRGRLAHSEAAMLSDILLAEVEGTTQIEATSNPKRVALSKLRNAGAVVLTSVEGHEIVTYDQLTRSRRYGRLHLSSDVLQAFQPLIDRRRDVAPQHTGARRRRASTRAT